MNPFNEGMVKPDPNDKFTILTELRSLELPDDWLSEDINPNVKEYILLSLNKINNEKFNLPELYPCWIQKDNVTVGRQILS